MTLTKIFLIFAILAGLATGTFTRRVAEANLQVYQLPRVYQPVSPPISELAPTTGAPSPQTLPSPSTRRALVGAASLPTPQPYHYTPEFDPAGPSCTEMPDVLMRPRLMVQLSPGSARLRLWDGKEMLFRAEVRYGRDTPEHRTPSGHGQISSINSIIWNPVWRPGPYARAEAAERGEPLSSEEPPYLSGNPQNGLGVAKIRLSGDWPPGFLIHGTNARERAEIGEPKSLMCVGLRNEDIEHLICLIQPTLETGRSIPVTIVADYSKGEFNGEELTDQGYSHGIGYAGDPRDHALHDLQPPAVRDGESI